VLSGPAASLVGAAWLSGLSDFIMSDMGGTTTDLGILQHGRPRVAEEGAEVGGWRTMVKAIDVKTIGLGGDSEILLGPGGRIEVGTQKAAPISLLAARYPETLDLLDADLADTDGGSLHGRFVLKPFGATAALKAELNAREAEILALVTDRPRAMRKIAVSSAAQRALSSLRRKGLVQVGAFTPSDAAHVLGLQENWNAAGARLAAKLLVRFRDMRAGDDERAENFCRDVWSETVAKTCRAILDTAFGQPLGGHPLVNAVCSGEGRLGLAAVRLTPLLPVVAVGGPARVFYGEVGNRLGCDIVHPPFYDVTNAVGAATGVVAQTVQVAVEGDGSGLFRVYGPSGVSAFTNGAAALAAARAAAEAAARQGIAALGAEQIQVEISEERHNLPDMPGEDGLLGAKIVAEAIGRPHLGGAAS
jgi:N-methylhydantoinase A/oxoprolinase/acetone carboxylase beta subunit